MGWIEAELTLTALAAMLSPTTFSFSVLVLVLGDRPLRTGLWFYVGALGATLGIGIVAAFVLGDAAADHTPSTPKTAVAIFDMVAGAFLLAFVVRTLRRPPNPRRAASMLAQMQKVASSPAVAIVGAGAISELDPTATEYIVNWVVFSVVSLLPLAVAIVLLLVARGWAERLLEGVRRWLDRSARTIAAVIIVALAASLIRNGIAGLTA